MLFLRKEKERRRHVNLELSQRDVLDSSTIKSTQWTLEVRIFFGQTSSFLKSGINLNVHVKLISLIHLIYKVQAQRALASVLPASNKLLNAQ